MKLTSRLRGLWRRPEARFLIVYVVLLGVGFTTVALRPVNDAVVVPYTTFVARMAGASLGVLGEDISLNGCELSSPRFAVTIYNGCNGLITSLIFVSGVLAFPATWRSKVAGVAVGLAAIQAINLVRIVSLFYVGVFLPSLFNESHIFVWQSVVIISGVALWVLWANWSTRRRRGAVESES